MKHSQILEACLVGFFPEMPAALRKKLGALVAAGAWEAKFIDKALTLMVAASYQESLEKLRLFCETHAALQGGLAYALSGLAPAVLNEFPAQRLTRVMEAKEPVDWAAHWRANGGKFYGGEMMALKWDPIWWRISVFGLPVAPFCLGSGYDLDEVGRSEAEAWGLIKPQEHPPEVKIEISVADLTTRVAVAVQSYCRDRFDTGADSPPR